MGRSRHGEPASRTAVTGTREIAVPNSLESLDDILAEIEAFATEAAISEHARRSLLLVAEEFFTNTVRHGYEPAIEDRVTVSIARDGDRVLLVFRDRARPFDIAANPPQPQQDDTRLADMKVGGLGLFLIHEVCRSVSWRHEDGVNISTFRIAVEAG